MKLNNHWQQDLQQKVTPFVGVWIETLLEGWAKEVNTVTPFVGVWIETPMPVLASMVVFVTPFVGVWIETSRGR